MRAETVRIPSIRKTEKTEKRSTTDEKRSTLEDKSNEKMTEEEKKSLKDVLTKAVQKEDSKKVTRTGSQEMDKGGSIKISPATSKTPSPLSSLKNSEETQLKPTLSTPLKSNSPLKISDDPPKPNVSISTPPLSKPSPKILEETQSKPQLSNSLPSVSKPNLSTPLKSNSLKNSEEIPTKSNPSTPVLKVKTSSAKDSPVVSRSNSGELPNVGTPNMGTPKESPEKQPNSNVYVAKDGTTIDINAFKQRMIEKYEQQQRENAELLEKKKKQQGYDPVKANIGSQKVDKVDSPQKPEHDTKKDRKSLTIDSPKTEIKITGLVQSSSSPVTSSSPSLQTNSLNIPKGEWGSFVDQINKTLLDMGSQPITNEEFDAVVNSNDVEREMKIGTLQLNKTEQKRKKSLFGSKKKQMEQDKIEFEKKQLEDALNLLRKREVEKHSIDSQHKKQLEFVVKQLGQTSKNLFVEQNKFALEQKALIVEKNARQMADQNVRDLEKKN